MRWTFSTWLSQPMNHTKSAVVMLAGLLIAGSAAADSPQLPGGRLRQIRPKTTVTQASHVTGQTHMHQHAEPLPQGIQALEATPAPMLFAPETIQLPPGAMTTNATYDPLWAGYQSDKQCGCGTTCDCSGHGKSKKNAFRSVLGKLTAGFDLLMFGTTKNGCDDCACDVPGESNACDALAAPMHVMQSPSHVMSLPHPPALPSTVPDAAPVKTVPAAPHVPANVRPQDEIEDPFQDDPITITGRSKVKPMSYRR